MPSSERIIYLFRRFIDKSYTPEEREELMDYISRSEHDSQLKELIEKSWMLEIPEYEQDERKADEIFNYILGREKPVKRMPRFRKRIFFYAGAVAASAIAVLALYNYLPRLTPKTSEKEVAAHVVYECKAGERKSFTLSDGTIVKLNSNSKLTMLNDFSGATRSVQLVGEGFFDVAHNKEKPFTIITNQMSVKVLGTAFNIKAYPEDDVFETSVIRGSVRVTFPSTHQEVVLHPNEKISLSNSNLNIAAREVKGERKKKRARTATVQQLTWNRDSSIVEISWTENKLAFADESFIEIVKKIERWYNVKVTFENDEVLKQMQKERFTATFNNEKLELVMEALQLVSKKFSYRIDGRGNVIIKN